MEVRFPKSSGSNLAVEYFETEKKLAEMNWKREKIEEDIQREQSLLNHVNYTFRIKKQAFIKYLADSSPYGSQVISYYYSLFNFVGIFILEL